MYACSARGHRRRGDLYVARRQKWLVSDLQLSLAQLAVKREKAKEKYFPSAYRWLLEE